LKATGPRRASEVHTSMFKSLLEAEQDYRSEKKEWELQEQDYKEQIKTLTEDVDKMRAEAEHHKHERRKSVSQLQDDMWKHLVEADELNKQQLKKLHGENKYYKDELLALKKHLSYLEASKLVLIDECNRQMNILRTGVRMMNQKKI